MYVYIYMIWAGQHVGQAPKLSTDAEILFLVYFFPLRLKSLKSIDHLLWMV